VALTWDGFRVAAPADRVGWLAAPAGVQPLNIKSAINIPIALILFNRFMPGLPVIRRF
jgi:hypothetical protein